LFYDEWSENQFVSGLSFNVENIFSGGYQYSLVHAAAW